MELKAPKEIKLGNDAGKVLANAARLRVSDLPDILLKQAADYRTRALKLDRVQENDSFARNLVDPKTGANVPDRMTTQDAANFLYAEATKREELARQLLNFGGSDAEYAQLRRQVLTQVMRQPADAFNIREANGNGLPRNPDPTLAPEAYALKQRLGEDGYFQTYKHEVGDLTTHKQPAEVVVDWEKGDSMKLTQEARDQETARIQQELEAAQGHQADYLSLRKQALALSDRADGLLTFAQESALNEIKKATPGKHAYQAPPAADAAAGKVEPKVKDSSAAKRKMTEIEKATPRTKAESRTKAAKSEPATKPRRTRATVKKEQPAAAPRPRRTREPRGDYMASPSNQAVLDGLSAFLSRSADNLNRDIPIVPRPQPQPVSGGGSFLSRLPIVGGLFGKIFG